MGIRDLRWKHSDCAELVRAIPKTTVVIRIWLYIGVERVGYPTQTPLSFAGIPLEIIQTLIMSTT